MHPGPLIPKHMEVMLGCLRGTALGSLQAFEVGKFSLEAEVILRTPSTLKM